MRNVCFVLLFVLFVSRLKAEPDGLEASYRVIGSDGNGAQITDQTTQFKLTYNITENIYISGHVDYSWVPSRSLRNERLMEYGMGTRSQVVYGGVSVGVNF